MVPSSFGSSYQQLLAQVRNHIRNLNTSDELFGLLRDAFGEVLEVHKVVLSRVEKDKLFQTVAKEVLNEVLTKVDKGANA